MLARRTKLSKLHLLACLVVVLIAPQFISLLTGDYHPELSFVISLVSFSTGSILFVWSRILTKVSLDETKFTVESPLGRREFRLPNDFVVSHSPGGTALVSKEGWPFFVFNPASYDLTDDQQKIVERLISSARSAQERTPIQPPENNARDVI